MTTRYLFMIIISFCAAVFLQNSPSAEEIQPETAENSPESEKIQNYDWIPGDFTVGRKEEGSEKVLIYLTDKDGKEFTLEFSPYDKIEAQYGEKLKSFKELIDSVSLYKIKNLHFLVRKASIDAHVIPESVSCTGEDLTASVPAGIFFSKSNEVSYNFRMVLGKYFVRISGVYVSDDAICAKVTSALADPLREVNKNDPALISARMETLIQEIERQELETLRVKYALVSKLNKGLFSGPRPPDKKMLKRLIFLKKQNPAISNEELKKSLEKDGFPVSSKEFDLIMDIYYPDYN